MTQEPITSVWGERRQSCTQHGGSVSFKNLMLCNRHGSYGFMDLSSYNHVVVLGRPCQQHFRHFSIK